MKFKIIALSLIVLLCFDTSAQVRNTFWHTVKNTITGKNKNEKAYYISYSTGSDSNDGLTPATAKKTYGFSVTDSNPIRKVYFKRGDTWPQFTKTIVSSADSITISAYGSGANPKLLGSKTITGWTKRSTTDVYVTKAGVSTVYQLFVNGVKQTEARYPNSGYDYIETVNTTSSFTSNELVASINYAGAKWIGRTNPYAMPTVNVSSSSSKTITLAEAPFGDLTATTEGFILVGKFEFLDAAGEWFYNTSTDSLYFWAPGNVDPDVFSVTASTVANGFVLSANASKLTIKNVELSEFGNYGISATSGGNRSNIITENTFKNNGYAAMLFSGAGSTGHTVINNTISNSVQMGMELFVTNSTIQDNNVDSISIFKYIGSTGIGAWYKGSGIYTEGSGNTIQYNAVTNSGYNGIHFYYPSTVQYNYVYNCNLTKDDGGGIYTSSPDVYPAAAQNDGSIIRYNIIDGSYGTLNGYTTLGYMLGEGIYLDESSGNIDVYGNSVGNVTSGAYYAHKGYDHLIQDNISFRARYGLLMKHKGYNIIAKKNKLYGFSRDYNNKQSEQMVWKFGTTTRPAIDSNTYIQHYKSTDIFADSITNYSFTNWKTATGKDAASTVDNAALGTNYGERWIYNNTKSAKTYYLNQSTNVTDAFTDATITTSFTLQPFTSKVLEGLNLDCIQDYSDVTAPIITAFTIPETGTLTISISSFTASGIATKYILTESATPPALTDANWSTSPPVSYTFSTAGAKTLYAWVRDAAGNISSSASDNTTVSVDMTDGLVAWYDFEDAGTVLVDEHTNGLNGTNKNSSLVDRNVTPVTGLPGSAYPYISTGLSRSIVADNLLLNFTGEFEIGSFINVTSLSGIRTVCSKANEFTLSVTTTGALEMRVYENGGTNFVTISSPAGAISTGTNYFVKVKSVGTNLKDGYYIYINNVEQTRSYAGNIGELTNGITDTSNDFIVGFSTNMSATMYGNISQLQIYNKVVPSVIWTNIYNSGNGKSYQDL